MSLTLRCAMLASLLGSLFAPMGTAQQYAVTDLGAFPGGNLSQGQAINIIGQVAGYARFADYNEHGFVWTDRTGLVDLGSLPPASNFSAAQGINAFGDVVGYSKYHDSLYQHAVLWSNGQLRDLGTLPGGNSSQANGINDLGEITGFANGTGPGLYAVIWDKQGGIRALSSLSGNFSQGNAINLEGEVAGLSITEDGTSLGVLWSKPLGIRALPKLAETDSFAYALGINNLGQVVGASGINAVLWQNDTNHTVLSLGVFPSGLNAAYAINDAGQVVGESGGAAFLWTQAQGLQNLDNLIPADSGWKLYVATAINDRGQITGAGLINGQEHGFLLTPVSH